MIEIPDSSEPLVGRIQRAMEGSCICGAGDLGIEHHAPLCHYRLFVEICDLIKDINEKGKDHGSKADTSA